MNPAPLLSAHRDEAVMPAAAEYQPQLAPFICSAFQGPLVESAAFDNLTVCVQFSLPDAFDFSVQFENREVAINPGVSSPANCHIELDALHFFLVTIELLSKVDHGLYCRSEEDFVA